MGIVAAVTAAVGVGTSIYGAKKQQDGLKAQQAAQAQQAAIAAQQAGYNVSIAQDEQKQDAIRRTAMQLDAKRNTIQNVRQAQQARAMSIAAATAQGAGFAGGFGPSSGYSGGQSQINSRNNFNLTGINQNLQAGEGMFSLNADISQQRINLANSGADMASAQGAAARGAGIAAEGAGFMSLGGQMVSAASTFGNIAKSAGGSSGGFNVFNGLPGGSLTGG